MGPTPGDASCRSAWACTPAGVPRPVLVPLRLLLPKPSCRPRPYNRQPFFLPEQADGPPPHVKSLAFFQRRNSVVPAPFPKLSMFSSVQF